MPDFRACQSLQKPMSDGPFTDFILKNRPLDFQKTPYFIRSTIPPDERSGGFVVYA